MRGAGGGGGRPCRPCVARAGGAVPRGAGGGICPKPRGRGAAPCGAGAAPPGPGAHRGHRARPARGLCPGSCRGWHACCFPAGHCGAGKQNLGSAQLPIADRSTVRADRDFCAALKLQSAGGVSVLHFSQASWRISV